MGMEELQERIDQLQKQAASQTKQESQSELSDEEGASSKKV